jgi:antagonist of KipI
MITFLKSGILTTFQDLGRNNYRSLGINPNGAMDKYAFRKINILLGNDENEGMIEMHFPAPEILFEEAAVIAIGGADFSPKINEVPIPNDKMIAVEVGSVLKFSRKINGERAYLAVKGGFETQQWLHSVSTNVLAKIGGHQFEKGDKWHFKQKNCLIEKALAQKFISTAVDTEKKIIRILAGNEFQLLLEENRQNVENQHFMISKNANRMGYQLDSKPLLINKKIELLSSAVDFGTIQLLPNGQLIILMADHQTTGGYPRLGHVISADLPILAQMGVGSIFQFKIISIEEAEEILFQEEKAIKKLKTSIKLLRN